jgi:hypothetical protein
MSLLSPSNSLNAYFTAMMQLSSHHVQPHDFYFWVNWDCLVKQELFSKQIEAGEKFLDSLFNDDTFSDFLSSSRAGVATLYLHLTHGTNRQTNRSKNPNLDLDQLI